MSNTVSELSKLGVDDKFPDLEIDETGLFKVVFEFSSNVRVPKAFTPHLGDLPGDSVLAIVDSKGPPIRFGAYDRAAGGVAFGKSR